MVAAMLNLGYSCSMRRIIFYIIVLFSFIMPLQVVAEALMAMPVCVEKHIPAIADDMAVSMPDCCDDEKMEASMADCPQMQGCHSCSIFSHYYTASYLPLTFFRADSIRLDVTNLPLLSSHPEDVWRPPTNS